MLLPAVLLGREPAARIRQFLGSRFRVRSQVRPSSPAKPCGNGLKLWASHAGEVTTEHLVLVGAGPCFPLGSRMPRDR